MDLWTYGLYLIALSLYLMSLQLLETVTPEMPLNLSKAPPLFRRPTTLSLPFLPPPTLPSALHTALLSLAVPSVAPPHEEVGSDSPRN